NTCERLETLSFGYLGKSQDIEKFLLANPAFLEPLAHLFKRTSAIGRLYSLPCAFTVRGALAVLLGNWHRLFRLDRLDDLGATSTWRIGFCRIIHQFLDGFCAF